MTLSGLLGRASGFRQNSEFTLRIVGPSWIDKDRYDIVAKIPPNTSRDQFRAMLMNLLMERFKLVVHHEAKQLSVYELLIDKDGIKMRESSGDPAALPSEGPPPREQDKDGFRALPAGYTGFVQSLRIEDGWPRAYWTARNSPVSDLVRGLDSPSGLNGLIVDKTGLTGRYDYSLKFAIDIPGAPADWIDPLLPSVFQALRSQLGLILHPTKAEIDVLVIDRVERVPVEN